MSPNLPGRYEHSIAKGEEQQAAMPLAFEAGALEECLGGCGERVGAGMKCVACATEAVVAWRARTASHSAASDEDAKPEAPRRRRK